MRAASIGTRDYGRGTVFDLPVAFGAEYSLTGKLVRIEMKASRSGAVLFRRDASDSGSDIAISSQVITVALAPSTVSTTDDTTTFAEVAAEYDRLDCSLSVGTDLDAPDYRIQWDLKIFGEHGKFTATPTS